MRLGGPIHGEFESPEAWVAAVRRLGYCAAYCPVKVGTDQVTIDAYARAAHAADIIIAEVGVWNNPLSPDPTIRAAAIEFCIGSLDLAERIGARCAVRVSNQIMPRQRYHPTSAAYCAS